MKYKSTYLASLVLSFVGLFAVICPSAKANYTATLTEVGSNVVGTGSGSLDLTGFGGPLPSAGGGLMFPSVGVLLLGAPALEDDYIGIFSGPTSFGSGGFASADIVGAAGPLVGIRGDLGFLFVFQGYNSGAPLAASTNTWSSATFASLGVTPGTYVWTWGSGIHADSYTLQIGPTNSVPETGSTIALMLGAVGTLIAFRQKLVERS
jgi:hypothetical protein